MALQKKEKLFDGLNKSPGKKKKPLKTKERQLGKYNGKIWISEDFNEPIESFKEYMS